MNINKPTPPHRAPVLRITAETYPTTMTKGDAGPGAPIDAYAERRTQLRVLGVPDALIAANRFGDISATAVRSATAIRLLVDAASGDARSARQRIGTEVEFHPRPTKAKPNAPLDTRDQVYEHLYRAIAAHSCLGKSVELCGSEVGSDNGFLLAKDERFYPILTDTFVREDHSLTVRRFRGHGPVVLTVTNGTETPYKTKHTKLTDVFEAAPIVDNLVRETFGEGEGPITHHTDILLMTKDSSGDTAKVAARMERTAQGDLVAVLTGVNGRFYAPDAAHPIGNPNHGGAVETVRVPIYTAAQLADRDMTRQTPEDDLRVALPILEGMVRGRVLMQKTDRYDSLSVQGIGVKDDEPFRIVHEEDRHLELVSPILDNAASVETTCLLVAALGARGYIGTTPEHSIGVHVHIELPIVACVAGGIRHSIAAALNVARAFLVYQATLYDLIPVDRNREPYIAPMHEELARFLADPAYGSNPTDRETIVGVIYDFVTRTDGKYHAINFEYHFARLLDGMLRDRFSAFRDGEIFTLERHGKTVTFTVGKDRATGEPNIFYTEDGELKPLIRTKRTQSTVELRFADTVHTEETPGVFTIDAATVKYLLEFGQAFGHRYGWKMASAAEDFADDFATLREPSEEEGNPNLANSTFGW